MSIATLAGKADQLIGYFAGQQSAINSALAAALAAAPTREVVDYYLDNIAGDDANDGITAATPVETWAGLVARMGQTKDRYFRSLRINLACDNTPVVFDTSVDTENTLLRIVGTWNPRGITGTLPRPTLQLMLAAGSGSFAGTAVHQSFTGHGVTVFASGLTIRTAADTDPPLPVNTSHGLLRGGHSQRLILEGAKLVLHQNALNDFRLDWLYLFAVDIERTQDGAGVPVIDSPHLWASNYVLREITIPAGENLPDVLGITQWDANGYPVGISSNVDLSEVV
jgi:hypothetical protein